MPLPTEIPSPYFIPLPADNEVAAVLGPSYSPDSTLNVIKMFAGTTDMCPAALGFIKAVFQAGGVPAKEREMIVLRSASKHDALYEWRANSTLAHNIGLSESEIAAASSDNISSLSPSLALVCRAVDELTDHSRLTDSTLLELLKHYGAEVARKLVLIIGWFSLLSLFVNGCRVPLETTDKIGGKTSPLG